MAGRSTQPHVTWKGKLCFVLRGHGSRIFKDWDGFIIYYSHPGAMNVLRALEGSNIFGEPLTQLVY